MPESKIYDTNPVKHVVVDDRYHMALKIYALKHNKTAKEIVEEALDKMPGFKEFLE